MRYERDDALPRQARDKKPTKKELQKNRAAGLPHRQRLVLALEPQQQAGGQGEEDCPFNRALQNIRRHVSIRPKQAVQT